MDSVGKSVSKQPRSFLAGQGRAGRTLSQAVADRLKSPDGAMTAVYTPDHPSTVDGLTTVSMTTRWERRGLGKTGAMPGGGRGGEIGGERGEFSNIDFPGAVVELVALALLVLFQDTVWLFMRGMVTTRSQ